MAFYPVRMPLQHEAKFLNGQDLNGDLTRAAHADGLKCSPAWTAAKPSSRFTKHIRIGLRSTPRDSPTAPAREEDGVVLYTTCINGTYYSEYIPSILREIIAHEKPDGFTDNHWAGLGRDSMCYCVNCQSKFRKFSGKDLPTRKNWDDPVYRQWIEWSYQRRQETWDLFTSTTKAAGGPDYIWSGIFSGNFVQAASSFREIKELCNGPT